MGGRISEPSPVGELIRQGLIRAHWTQADLSRELGVTQKHLSAVIVGSMPLSFALAQQIAGISALGLDLDHLLAVAHPNGCPWCHRSFEERKVKR